MKKIFVLFSILFCMNVFAEELGSSEAEKIKYLNDISKIVSYNATLLGYANYCKFDASKINLIKSQFLSVIDQIGLKGKDYDNVKRDFFEKLDESSNSGNSSLNCDNFKIDFEKIYQTIKNGTT